MLGCSGIETIVVKSAALWTARAYKNCELIRKMFLVLEAGKGKHLLSVVKPHFESCDLCRSWAEINNINYGRAFRRANK